jgi:hypothetical protein
VTVEWVPTRARNQNRPWQTGRRPLRGNNQVDAQVDDQVDRQGDDQHKPLKLSHFRRTPYAIYWQKLSSPNMQSSTIPRSEELLCNLIHDLRQPLGNIETSAYLLNLVTPPDPPEAHAQILAIERQVNQASGLLEEASAALAGLRAQRLEGATEPLAGRQGAGPGGYPAQACYKEEVTGPECVTGDSFDLTKPVNASVT